MKAWQAEAIKRVDMAAKEMKKRFSRSTTMDTLKSLERLTSHYPSPVFPAGGSIRSVILSGRGYNYPNSFRKTVYKQEDLM